MGRKIKPILGKRHEMLVVVKEDFDNRDEKGRWLVTVRCDCGNEKEIQAGQITKTKYCGCAQNGEHIKHGAYNEPWYNNWKNMRERTQNKNSINYDKYKDVYVDPRYLTDPWAFFNDIEGVKVDNTYSVDRIDVNKGYEKGNMRWASILTQANNKHNTRPKEDRYIVIERSKYRVLIKRKDLFISKRFDTIEEARLYRDDVVK
jgi:hypothetical protein